MSFSYFLKLLLKNLVWLLAVPIVMACTIFYFTRHEVKVYSSESVIYTGLASGYNLSGNTKADFFSTTNAFDNLLSLINSRETKQEVSINLLANHLMLQKHDAAVMSWGTFEELKKLVPDSVRKLIVKPTFEATVNALRETMNGKEGNVIYSIINSSNPFYSINALDNVKSGRINNSDLIRISYQTNDAAICKETLEILERAFMRKHKSLKEGQSESVLDYFETETKNAYSRLNAAENSFMNFNKSNDIINYYEQTKAVAGERENLFAQNHNLEMDNMASNKSLQKINESMKGRLYQNEYGSAILKEREALSEINSKIAIEEIIGVKDSANLEVLDKLRKTAFTLKKKMDGSVNNLYLQTNTPSGIPTKNILDEWLTTTLTFEQSQARLTVMDKRKEDFVKEYRKYAPLGAMLKKIERQINVSEQEYMELLHGLNTAKLTQQNNELTSKLNIVDPPYLPLKANASKRMVLIIVGFLVGFMLVLIVILAKALINKTVQTPDKASRQIGIPLLGVYPLLNENNLFIEKANLRLLQKLLACIDLQTKPFTIGLFSMQGKEGKSTMMDLFYKNLTALDYKVEKLSWKENMDPIAAGIDIVLVEFPQFDSMIIKQNMLPTVNHSILICRANRIWSRIDKDLLAIYSKTTGNRPSLLLNGVNADFAEEYIGEVQKKRSTFRKFLKGLMKFEFGNKNKI